MRVNHEVPAIDVGALYPDCACTSVAGARGLVVPATDPSTIVAKPRPPTSIGVSMGFHSAECPVKVIADGNIPDDKGTAGGGTDVGI